MPFTARPPGALFIRRMMQTRNDTPPQPIEKKEPSPAMRLFPLETEPPRPTARARTVSPLPQRPIITNTLGQSVPQQHMLPNAMPRPPVTQPAMPTPTAPETAVAQFQRVNKSLPDGVRYEPLDEETLRLLRENGHLPSPPVQEKPEDIPAEPQKMPEEKEISPEAVNVVEKLLEAAKGNDIEAYNELLEKIKIL
ncbi:MAG: hypothetical protein FWB87_04405 [Defluviitaleaceae bacterium]|nr:hypothetical protein [Defluviitaleaceae bacterium]